MLSSIQQASHSTPINRLLTFALGATDGTSEGSIYTGCGADASDPMINASIKLDNKVLRLATAAATETSSTTDAECSIVTGGSMSTAGQFTVNWTTVGNTTAHQICYIALDSSATTETVTQTSIHKYDLAQYIPSTSVHKYNLLQYLLQT